MGAETRSWIRGPAAGNSRRLGSTPRAVARAVSVSRDGSISPASIRDTVAWSRPAALASRRCETPRAAPYGLGSQAPTWDQETPRSVLRMSRLSMVVRVAFSQPA